MATTLLYHRDPLLLSFDATVAAVDGAAVILAETAFYPEAGGQMADRGVLAGKAIVDVQVDDAGVVRHVLEGDAAAGVRVGDVVHGEIDRARRRQFMALHTAQHMLSRALISEAGAETVSARLGESVCTIDVDVPAVSEGKLAQAEALTNSVVDDDLPIRAWFPDEAELRALPLRRQPKVSENVRVVAVGGGGGGAIGATGFSAQEAFDVSPCGGTHCTRTAQIALVRVVGVEKYKGMTRVFFQAGPRARAEVFDRARVLEGLAKELSSSPADVRAGIEKLRAQVKSARDDRALLVQRLAVLLAAELVAAQPGRVVALVDGDVELLRAVGERIARHENADAVLACTGADGVSVFMMRASSPADPKAALDAGALLKKVAAAGGGRGGGKPERAEGKLPPGADFLALVAAAGLSL